MAADILLASAMGEDDSLGVVAFLGAFFVVVRPFLLSEVGGLLDTVLGCLVVCLLVARRTLQSGRQAAAYSHARP